MCSNMCTRTSQACLNIFPGVQEPKILKRMPIQTINHCLAVCHKGEIRPDTITERKFMASVLQIAVRASFTEHKVLPALNEKRSDKLLPFSSEACLYFFSFQQLWMLDLFMSHSTFSPETRSGGIWTSVKRKVERRLRDGGLASRYFYCSKGERSKKPLWHLHFTFLLNLLWKLQ